MKKKKMMTLILVTSIISFVGILILVVLALIPGQEKKMTKELSSLGKKYYTERWYPNNTNNLEGKELENFLANFNKNGIKVNLDSINVVFRKDIDVMKTFTYKDKECDKLGTYIYFYPEAPYGEKDVRIEATLDCGFNSKK